eukprot:6202864-Pleurochrysis_carterae.AAC.1
MATWSVVISIMTIAYISTVKLCDASFTERFASSSEPRSKQRNPGTAAQRCDLQFSVNKQSYVQLDMKSSPPDSHGCAAGTGPIPTDWACCCLRVNGVRSV